VHICNADRLPADELDTAILKALLATYQHSGLIDKAIEQAWQQSQADAGRRADELGAIDTEISKAEKAIDRYLTAFENGTISESDCGPRLRKHSTRIAELTHRRAELAKTQHDRPAAPTRDDLDRLRSELQDALEHGPNPARKALIQSLVQDIRVEGRDCVRPTFRIPNWHAPLTGVRDQSTSVGRRGLEPRTRGLKVRLGHV
jgi:site-specific DNA recombinase